MVIQFPLFGQVLVLGKLIRAISDVNYLVINLPKFHLELRLKFRQFEAMFPERAQKSKLPNLAELAK